MRPATRRTSERSRSAGNELKRWGAEQHDHGDTHLGRAISPLTFEPDAEYVDGEIRTRPMGTYSHADWQMAIATWFFQHAKEWNVRSNPQQRTCVRPGK